MADIDLLRPRGVPFAALVDATGVATGGTSTVAQLAGKGMRAIAAVDPTGLALDGTSKVADLAARGIRAFAPIDELGVSTDDAVSTADAIRKRGIRPMVAVDANGVSQTGSATIPVLAQRGLGYFCPLDESGNATSLVPVPPNTIRARPGIFNLYGQPATLTPPVAGMGSVTMQAGVGTFAMAGEDMTPIAGWAITAGKGDFALAGQAATMTPPVRGVSADYVGEGPQNIGSTGNSFVISGVPIGNPTYIATRRVIVVLEGVSSNGWHCLGGSIGASTIDQFTDNGYTSAGSDVVEILSAVVTSGTTATVTVNFGGNPVGLQRIYVYTADNSRMIDPTHPVTARDENTSGTDVNSVTFNTSALANGFIICGIWAGGGSGPTITSSTDAFTTDVSTSAYMAAHANGITATTTYNIQTHAPPAGGNSLLATAAFR